MKTWALTLVLLLGTFVSLSARPWTENDYKAAYRLMETMKLDKVISVQTEQWVDKQIRRMPFLKKSRGRFMEFFRKNVSYQSIRKELAEIFLQEFTAAELNRIADFFATPEGQKILNKAPVITEKIEDFAKEKIMEHKDEFQQLLQEEIARRMSEQ